MGNEIQKNQSRDIIAQVEAKVGGFVRAGQLSIPPGYAVGNALKGAWLLIQQTVNKDGKNALQVCSPESIGMALLDMVVKGLNPLKKQCYFIVYGSKLVCQESVFGIVHLAKTHAGVSDVYSQVVYAGDEFAYEIKRGRKTVAKHVQKIENVQPGKIVAAYAVVEKEGVEVHTEIMTMDQIHRSWTKSKNNPDSPNSVHAQFDEEMAKRTVTRRAVKLLLNSSSDANILLTEALQRPDLIEAEAELDEAAELTGSVEMTIDGPPVEMPPEAAMASQPEPEQQPLQGRGF